MKTKTNKILIGALIAAAFTFNSCKKDETPVTKSNNVAVKMEAFKQTAKQQIAFNAFFVKMSTQSLPQLISKTSRYMKREDGIEDGFSCAVVTIDSSTSPRVATFDFGSGCSSNGGPYFAGKITMQYTNPDMRVAGNHIVATFYNFSADSFAYNGTLDYTNDGTNGAGNMIGHATVNMATNLNHDRVILNGTTTISFEWVQARNTSMLTIGGTATDGNGIQFTQSTSSTIYFNLDPGCIDHFTKGALLLQSVGLSDETIDYGNGACDDQATSTISGVTTPFTLQ